MQKRDVDVVRGPLPSDYQETAIAHLVDGVWLEQASGDRHTLLNPANGEAIGSFYGSGAVEVTAAAEAAGRSLHRWSRMPAPERGAILARAADLMRDRAVAIALDLTVEQGKPLPQARGEVLGSAAVLDWFAELARRSYGRTVPALDGVTLQTVTPRPVGAVAVLTPWNSPLGTSVRTVAAALAAGCTVVLKPASETPRSALGFARALVDAGVPQGVFNCILGRAGPISAQLIDHPAIRKISFTGSVAVGRQLARRAGERLKPLVLELGGHAPVVIFDDVDVTLVAKEACAAKFDNAGQICIAPSRFYVHRKAYRDFLDAMATEVDSIRIGEGWVEGVGMGPLANSRRVDEIDRLAKDALSSGGKLIRGGNRLGNRGCFYAPTLIGDVSEGSAVMQEEPFGPLAAVLPFDTEDEVISRSNALPFGLAGYVFSRDMVRLDRVGAQLEVGMAGLNNFAISKPELPFTGIKDSGYGYSCGEEGFESFVIRHTVTRRHAHSDCH
ncbi:MAG: NAD-dependent succinate-semialdehyde dehydrogenase [Mesorhizobium sp.]|uniref:NAD-dependent succinate-semialdehyde dehydrogenase n=1 Tax=Mesorhizobium sp. TaxID=1871066 RepID=UPI000FE71165|nr:NAD-dependent succinate-semialdehyde dehydrogenase [Mesorhizobium sp.]RWL17932.1 MAG: NAD-dependent succinate-semialdehyde dehydrogenase [Mesorhizobium sp.]